MAFYLDNLPWQCRSVQGGTSLDTQIENCEDQAKKAGYIVLETLRKVFTGSLYHERPRLSKLRKMARNHEMDVIIINTFDRLSRNQTHLAVLIDEFEHLGMKLVCVKENFDETTEGQFMRNALAFVAEVECKAKLNGKRCKRG